MTITDWLTLVLVLITAFYAWAAFRILKANESVVGACRSRLRRNTPLCDCLRINADWFNSTSVGSSKHGKITCIESQP